MRDYFLAETLPALPARYATWSDEEIEYARLAAERIRADRAIERSRRREALLLELAALEEEAL